MQELSERPNEVVTTMGPSRPRGEADSTEEDGRIYLDIHVDYNDRRKAGRLGARWDRERGWWTNDWTDAGRIANCARNFSPPGVSGEILDPPQVAFAKFLNDHYVVLPDGVLLPVMNGQMQRAFTKASSTSAGRAFLSGCLRRSRNSRGRCAA